MQEATEVNVAWREEVMMDKPILVLETVEGETIRIAPDPITDEYIVPSGEYKTPMRWDGLQPPSLMTRSVRGPLSVRELATRHGLHQP